MAWSNFLYPGVCFQLFCRALVVRFLQISRSIQKRNQECSKSVIAINYFILAINNVALGNATMYMQCHIQHIYNRPFADIKVTDFGQNKKNVRVPFFLIVRIQTAQNFNSLCIFFTYQRYSSELIGGTIRGCTETDC